MSTGTLLQLTITTGITVSIALIAWWARKHPNRSKDHAERIRAPKVVPAVGWLLIAVGLLMGVVALFTTDPPIGMVISSAAMFLGGGLFLLAYRNAYVAPRQYEVAFRKSLGSEYVLPYSDIVRYRMQKMRGQPFLTVKFSSGVTLSMNVNAFNMAPLLRAIDYHRATGSWPTPVDAVDLPPAEAAARNDSQRAE